MKILFHFNDKIFSNIYTKLFNYNTIFINYYFFKFYNINDKYSYIFNYILLKKQNSFLRKKVNLFNNFYSMSQKSNKLFDRKLEKKTDLSYFINYYKLDYNTVINLDAQKLIDLKKKMKKTILDNRKIIKKVVFTNTVRSYSLTRFINVFGKKKIWNNIISFEFRLLNILINSGLIKSYNDGLIFLKLNGIFVNRGLIKNANYLLVKGDIVELLYTKMYYIYLLKFKYICEKNILKIRNKIWLKFKNKHSLTEKNENNVLNVYINNWLLKYNIPNYLEVDYFTLTVCIVSSLKNINETSFFFRRFFALYLFRLYNWKWLI